MRRFSLRLAGALMLATVGAIGANAKELAQFSEAGWDGWAFSFDGSGGFSHCTVSSTYNSGATLLFTLTEKFDFAIGLAHDDWLFRRDDKIAASLSVDSHGPFKGTARAIREEMIQFVMPATDPVYQLFRLGRMLHVRFENRSYDFRLDGTARALARLIKCVQTYAPPVARSAPEKATAEEAREAENDTSAVEQPPPKPKAPATDPTRAAQRLEATEIATNIAADAGLQGFRIVNDQEERKRAGSPDVLWVAGNLIGSANIIDDLGGLSIDQIAAVRSADLTGCEKERSTAMKRENLDGVVTVTTVIRCVDAGDKPVLVDTTLIERRPGVFFEFGIVYAGSESDGAAVGEGSIGANVRDAVLTIVKPQ